MRLQDKLRALRKACGLSQTAFSELVGASLLTYQGYENGKYSLPQYVLEKLRDIYNLDLAIFADEGNDIYLPPGGVKKAVRKNRRLTAKPTPDKEPPDEWPELPERCHSCCYRVKRGRKTVGCAYVLTSGERRGCPVGDGCIRYRPDRRRQEHMN